MIAREKYIYYLFIILLLTFFVIPEPIQKPIRIFIALSFFATYFSLLLKHKVSLFSIIPVLGATTLLLLSYYKGNLQSSLINAYLCFFFILFVKKNDFRYLSANLNKLNKIYYLLIFGILMQFLIFRSVDGRPTLSYETNLSGAYLFLFFLLSDILNKKSGKVVVTILSFILLSRLLIYAIVIFYIVRYGKKLVKNKIYRINIFPTVFILYLLFSAFSVWYSLNIVSAVSYQTDSARVTNVNDGSNKIRFEINSKVILSIIELDKTLLWGYGDVHTNQKYINKYFLMPHMELFDILVEFGVFILLFFAYFMLKKFNFFFIYENFEIIISVLFFTLFLWVRFLLTPSFESIFILFLLYISNYKNETITNKIQLTI